MSASIFLAGLIGLSAIQFAAPRNDKAVELSLAQISLAIKNRFATKAVSAQSEEMPTNPPSGSKDAPVQENLSWSKGHFMFFCAACFLFGFLLNRVYWELRALGRRQ